MLKVMGGCYIIEIVVPRRIKGARQTGGGNKVREMLCLGVVRTQDDRPLRS